MSDDDDDDEGNRVFVGVVVLDTVGDAECELVELGDDDGNGSALTG